MTTPNISSQPKLYPVTFFIGIVLWLIAAGVRFTLFEHVVRILDDYGVGTPTLFNLYEMTPYWMVLIQGVIISIVGLTLKGWLRTCFLLGLPLLYLAVMLLIAGSVWRSLMIGLSQ